VSRSFWKVRSILRSLVALDFGHGQELACAFCKLVPDCPPCLDPSRVSIAARFGSDHCAKRIGCFIPNNKLYPVQTDILPIVHPVWPPPWRAGPSATFLWLSSSPTGPTFGVVCVL
jgi:hypothetical protein